MKIKTYLRIFYRKGYILLYDVNKKIILLNDKEQNKKGLMEEYTIPTKNPGEKNR